MSPTKNNVEIQSSPLSKINPKSGSSAVIARHIDELKSKEFPPRPHLRSVRAFVGRHIPKTQKERGSFRNIETSTFMKTFKHFYPQNGGR